MLRSTIFFTMDRGAKPPSVEQAQYLESVARRLMLEWCDPNSIYVKANGLTQERVLDAKAIGLEDAWAKKNQASPDPLYTNPFSQNETHHTLEGLVKEACNLGGGLPENFMRAVNNALRQIFPDMPGLTCWLGITDPLPALNLAELESKPFDDDPDLQLPTLKSMGDTKGKLQ